MAWTSLTFAFGSLLTSTKMTQMQDNFEAVAQGLSGAPALVVATSNINANAVTAAKISTSTGSSSGSGSPVTISLNARSFFPNISGSGHTVTSVAGTAGPDNPRFQLSGGSTYDTDWRYIT